MRPITQEEIERIAPLVEVEETVPVPKEVGFRRRYCIWYNGHHVINIWENDAGMLFPDYNVIPSVSVRARSIISSIAQSTIRARRALLESAS